MSFVISVSLLASFFRRGPGRGGGALASEIFHHFQSIEYKVGPQERNQSESRLRKPGAPNDNLR